MTKSTPLRDQSSKSSIAPFLVVILLLLPAASHAQEMVDPPADHRLTLADCIALALQESPAIEASRFDVASASEEVRAEQGKTLPRITGEATGELFSGSPTGKFSVVDFSQGGGGGGARATTRTVGLTGV